MRHSVVHAPTRYQRRLSVDDSGCPQDRRSPSPDLVEPRLEPLGNDLEDAPAVCERVANLRSGHQSRTAVPRLLVAEAQQLDSALAPYEASQRRDVGHPVLIVKRVE